MHSSWEKIGSPVKVARRGVSVVKWAPPTTVNRVRVVVTRKGHLARVLPNRGAVVLRGDRG